MFFIPKQNQVCRAPHLFLMVCCVAVRVQTSRHALELTLLSPVGQGVLPGLELVPLMPSSSLAVGWDGCLYWWLQCSASSHFMLWGTSAFHSRLRDDILSTFLSFLSPGIAITILHSAASCGSLQFIFKVSPKTYLVRVFA